MEPNLSSRLQAALSQREPSATVFQLASLEGSELQLLNVTASQWYHFVILVLARVPTQSLLSSPPYEPSDSSAPPPTLHCDVGIACRETFHACLLEGACLCGAKTFCVLNPDDPPRRTEELCRQIRPSVHITDDDVQAMLTVVHAATEGQTWTCSEWRAAVTRLVVPCEDTVVAYYMHTSGSTGAPKCVVGTRGNLLAYGYAFARDGAGLAWAGTGGCGFLTVSTPFFDPSLGDTVCTLLSEDGWQRMVLRKSVTDGDLAQLLHTQPFPTHIISTPALWNTIAPPGLTAGAMPVLPATTKLFLGGEKLTQRVIDEWAGNVELYNIYGVTEGTVYQSVARVRAGASVHDVTCGCGAGLNTFDIQPVQQHDGDADLDGELAGAGELVLRGPQVCLGYASDIAATGRGAGPFRVVPGAGCREYKTGDLARWDGSRTSARAFVLVGRRDRQVKINGQRTSLEAVEATMQRVLGGVVVECCSAVDRGQEGSKSVIAAGCVVVVEAGNTGDGDSQAVCFSDYVQAVQRGVQELLQHYLPPHAVPTAWLLLPSTAPQRLPRSATGKLDRQRVAAMATSAVTRAPCDEQTSGATPNEELPVPPSVRARFATVKGVWEAELGVPVHPRTHFFLVGGDSLGALKLCRAVFMALDGRDDRIDTCGGLPAAFRPHLLMQHPRLLDYVVALSELLDAEVTEVATAPSPRAAPHVSEAQSKPTATATDAGDAEALMAAVSLGNTCLAELLIQHKISGVNGLYSRTTRCVTPLHIAAKMGNVAMTDVLLRHGAKTTAVSPDGVTPLHIAAGASQAVLERLLQAPGAAVHSRDGRQQSLLHVAARHGRVDTVRYLLVTQHLDLAVRDKWQRSPAHWAALHGHVDVLRVMVEAGGQAHAHSDGSCRKRARGGTTSRFVRLAQKRTTLPYETLSEVAARVAPDDVERQRLCAALTPVVEEG